MRPGRGHWGGSLGWQVLPRARLGALQVWSITYHSWLTFVLLLWACLIWTMRSRHHFAMLCSPFILLYGLALCGLQYVWGMDLAPELPTRLGSMSLEQLGLAHTPYPCLDLGAKVSPSPPPACPSGHLYAQLVPGLTYVVPAGPLHPHLLAAAAPVRQGEAAEAETPACPPARGDRH